MRITPNEIITTDLDKKVILYPTETVYGLGCSVHDLETRKRIHEIKQRDFLKQCIQLVGDFSRIKLFIDEISKEEERIFNSELPISLLLKAGKQCPKYLTGPTGLISVRRTTHPICLELIKKLGAPLVSTSANPSGFPAINSLSLLEEEFINKCDIVIDIGELPPNIPSTIVQIKNGEIIIHREGAIKKEEIEKILDKKSH